MAHEGEPAAPAAASERACDRCRERRVKCDKRQPACLRCEKLGKPCPGYDKKRKFVDEGASLRKKYQRSDEEEQLLSEGPAVAGAGSANSSLFSPPKGSPGRPPPSNANNQHGRSQSSLSIGGLPGGSFMPSFPSAPLPSRTQPAQDTKLPPDILLQDAPIDGDAMLDDFWNDQAFDPEWFNIDPIEYYSNGLNSCGFIPNVPKIIDEVDRSDLVQQSTETAAAPTPMSFSDMNVYAPESQLNTSAIITDEREHEMAYLIRHFTEAIGPWMDLFDRDKHFGNLVPLKALRDALLRNAIAAVAAKQLARVKGSKPFMSNQFQKPATMEVFEDSNVDADWFYKAANYYDKAIAFSRVYLQAMSGVVGTPGTPGTQAVAAMANPDDLLVAVSIFSLYESLDNLEIGWLQHLSGLKTLLNTVNLDEQTQSQSSATLNIGKRASFWNFARADYQASYINHQPTFLNTEDLPLWQNCGLQIQADGSLYHKPAEIKSEATQCRSMADLVSHTLLWLLLRVTNYLASDKDDAPMMRQARWLQLTGQLEDWYQHLPQTFQPCAQIRYPMRNRMGNGAAVSHLTEVFFSIDVCAAAVQLYHFARILLLLNKPMEPHEMGSAGGGMLKALRDISSDCIGHAHQIVGIALGRPQPAVRVEMLLPLYVAGSCLEADEERRVVLELLKAIEKDTGCSTEKRCGMLTKEWGWNIDGQGVAMAA